MKVWDRDGIELAAPGSAIRPVTDRTTWHRPNLFIGRQSIKVDKSKNNSKDQESKQSSTTPVLGYQMGKKQNHSKHHKQGTKGQSMTNTRLK